MGLLEDVMRILLVDDDSTFRESCAIALRRKDHYIIEAENGNQAVQILTDNREFDAIVTDVNMHPFMDGIGLLQYMYGMGFTPPCYVQSWDTTWRSRGEVVDLSRFLHVAFPTAEFHRKIDFPKEIVEFLKRVGREKDA